jgi:hypothetical protein
MPSPINYEYRAVLHLAATGNADAARAYSAWVSSKHAALISATSREAAEAKRLERITFEKRAVTVTYSPPEEA